MENEEWDYEYYSDTAQCGACGGYYCTCCGCDCMFGDIYEDYVEEDETEETYWIVKRMERRDGELTEVGSYGFESEEDGNKFIAEKYGDGYLYSLHEEVPA